ncbi:hypothetical protein N0V93_010324 [Gnomoniopsis smithogilvyi]|uniref:Uncharacterized protein n=1 Tax=Gnomoniopsis smithogilvyi TaxID=1191159 RepID=A0A9W9CSR7_9PEZI|nr:hypothetical protein N0V93_010324 [Gnomoniopsis smithogilvyi]
MNMNIHRDRGMGAFAGAPQHTRHHLGGKDINVLIAAWSPFNFDVTNPNYNISPQDVFDPRTISDVIQFLIDRNIVPNLIGPQGSLDSTLMRRGDPLPDLLDATSLTNCVFTNGPDFRNAVLALLVQGCRDWLVVLSSHGVLVEHEPPRGAARAHARHWEWCDNIVSEWRHNPMSRDVWVITNICRAGPAVDADAQQRRHERIEEILRELRASGDAEYIRTAGPENIPLRLRPLLEEYFNLSAGRPWPPPQPQQQYQPPPAPPQRAGGYWNYGGHQQYQGGNEQVPQYCPAPPPLPPQRAGGYWNYGGHQQYQGGNEQVPQYCPAPPPLPPPRAGEYWNNGGQQRYQWQAQRPGSGAQDGQNGPPSPPPSSRGGDERQSRFPDRQQQARGRTRPPLRSPDEEHRSRSLTRTRHQHDQPGGRPRSRSRADSLDVSPQPSRSPSPSGSIRPVKHEIIAAFSRVQRTYMKRLNTALDKKNYYSALTEEVSRHKQTIQVAATAIGYRDDTKGRAREGR